MTGNRDRICIGVITGAHGIKGGVSIKSFTADPGAVLDYGSPSDKSGEHVFAITLTGRKKDLLLAEIDGVTDRAEAEALKGTELYIDRSALPETEEDEFYLADLIGLDVVFDDGETAGTVAAVQNFGAGDFMEIRTGERDPLLIPFTKTDVPEIDIAAGRLVVKRPLVIYADETKTPAAKGTEDDHDDT